MTNRDKDPEAGWIRQILLWHSERAADQLVSRYYDGLLAYIRSQVVDGEEAQNLTQETFIAALRSLASYDPAKAGFRTWLYRIGTYKVIDYWRRTPPQALSIDAPTSGTNSSEGSQDWSNLADSRQEDILQTQMKRDLVARIAQYVGAAAPKAQETFRLHLYAGYSFEQISQMSGDSESTVKARYYRLVNDLRKVFGHER